MLLTECSGIEVTVYSRVEDSGQRGESFDLLGWGEAYDLAEIQTNHLPNTSLQRRHYTRPFS